jgi:hypothetical protein
MLSLGWRHLRARPLFVMKFSHQLKAIFDTEFAIDAVKMNLDGSLANAKAARDYLVR